MSNNQVKLYRGYYLVSYTHWDEVDIYDYDRMNHIDTAASYEEAQKLVDSWISAP